jgi:uncharacterized damage-inducible protein DinB
MNIYGGHDLAKAFRTVRNNTIKIAEEIPEDKYGFQAASESRTAAQTLIHIANAPRFQYHLHAEKHLSTVEGFDFMGYMAPIAAEEKKSHSKAEILQQLRDGGEKLATWLDGLSDAFLAETVSYPPPMQPPVKTRFEMLLGIKEHEMHHRAQLMVLERMLGITPHLTRDMQARIAALHPQAAGKAS